MFNIQENVIKATRTSRKLVRIINVNTSSQNLINNEYYSANADTNTTTTTK